MRSFDIVALAPSGLSDPVLAVAASRAGGIGVLNLTGASDLVAAESDIARMMRHADQRTGVRIGGFDSGAPARLAALIPAAVDYVVISAPTAAREPGLLAALQRVHRQVWIEVTSVEEANGAVQTGLATALIAKGNEAGGRVGEETTYVLLQRLLRDFDLPVVAYGGIGLHIAAACYAAGASGVVLDLQLALLRESVLPTAVKTAIEAMDGGETASIKQPDGDLFRVFSRGRVKASTELPVCEDDVNWSGGAGESAWPIGQDAAFAADFARRFRTVGGVITAIRDAVRHHLCIAGGHNAIAEGSPLAASHGTRYPIVQGAMTRVSDRAAFANAVADGGALPLLALALMRESDVEPLLDETRRMLGAKPWGVGVLGFVPAELRDEQLRLVRKYKPPFALIAGGRPDQAQDLEKDGIATYLHVPSPGLLRMFVQEGARRFVFEGRECGGHVGPRSSFVLWNTMVDVLLELPQAQLADCHILFAGGIHDAPSAAMVAALSAPLQERGARVGVLLGTAYLFTHEAVSTGAIIESFQRNSLTCDRTVLLESGPGHAIRCIANDYVAEFEREKSGLRAAGKSGEEIRDSLESLSTGRLRIASKGIRRATDEEKNASGSRFVDVNADDAFAQGMYMVGQVAVMHDHVVSIAQLHGDVSEGGTSLLSNAARTLEDEEISTRQKPAAVAIIGMSCILPKSRDVGAYWKNILSKVSGITEVPADRWDEADYFDADRTARDKAYSKWGGFIDAVAFDPLEFGMPPASLNSIEPLQLLTLIATRDALKDAGYADRPFDRSRTSTVLGLSGGLGELGGRYMNRTAFPGMFGSSGADLVESGKSYFPEWDEDAFAGILPNVTAGRIANRFNFGGMNFSIDAACGSSLAAVHTAVRELESRATDMVVAGGADNTNTAFSFVAFSKTQALSPTGECRTFDASADGIAISEGIVMLVLKRLEDAERDGDKVYAVIRGTGASSDGRAKGLTAPRAEGQALALTRAYDAAGIAPATVGLIEAHGTGTVVGDRTEAQALTSFMTEAGAAPASIAVGSVKSLIGHTKAAAGMAGLAKAALALHHKVLPPTAGVTVPNPSAGFGSGPLYVNSEARPWIQPAGGTTRRAGISAFGFGGTNFHVVLEEYESLSPQVSGGDEWPAELFLWSASSYLGIREQTAPIVGQLSSNATPSLRDLAFSVCEIAAARREPGNFELAIVATSLEDLSAKIEKFQQSIATSASLSDASGIYASRQRDKAERSLAFVYPGQGSQYPDMLRDLAVRFGSVRQAFERFDSALAGTSADGLTSKVFPVPAFTDEERLEQRATVTDTRIAQPALGAADVALSSLLQSLGVKPDMVAGHSYGEYVALWASGMIDELTLARISESRGRAIAECSSGDLGTMAAVSASAESVELALKGVSDVWIANINAPSQTIISGSKSGIENARLALETRRLSSTPIPVACAFHSPLVAPARKQLDSELGAIQFAKPTVPVFSNTRAAEYPTDQVECAALLSEHLTSPVRFQAEIEAMYESGARIFVEVGPRNVLTGLIRKILEGRPFIALAVDGAGNGGLKTLLNTLAQLAVIGVDVNTQQLFSSRDVHKVDIGKLGQSSQITRATRTTWMVDPARAWPAGSQRPSHRMPDLRAWAGNNGENPTTPGSLLGGRSVKGWEFPAPGLPLPGQHGMTPSDEVMLEFQRVMTRALEVQQNVMLAYLNGEVVHAPGIASGHTIVNVDPERVSLNSAIGNGVVPHGVASVAGDSVAVVLHSPEAVLASLLEVVSERTGYPSDMLGLDVDLEGELGIDSIKRTEILGAVRKSALGDRQVSGAMEELARARTLRAIADTLVRLASEFSGGAAKLSPATATATATATAVTAGNSILARSRLTAVEAPLMTQSSNPVSGAVYVLTDDERGIAAALANRIAEAGAKAVVLCCSDASVNGASDGAAIDLSNAASVAAALDRIRGEHGPIAGVIHLLPLRAGADDISDTAGSLRRIAADVKGFFNLMKAGANDLMNSLDGKRTALVGVTAMGGDWGLSESLSLRDQFFAGHGGIAGLVKTAKQEWPDTACKAIDVEIDLGSDQAAGLIFNELVSSNETVQIGYRDGVRYRFASTASPVSSAVHHGNAAVLTTINGLEPGSVVIATGGARGITAEVGIGLAATAAGSTWILVGRAPVPADVEDGETGRLVTVEAVRAHFLAVAKSVAHRPSISAIEARVQSLMKEREIRRNLVRFAAAGAHARYVQADVGDPGAVAELVQNIRAEFGRLDGVIHGAGIIDDRLIETKSEASFDSVFDPKVRGAFALARALDSHPPSFLVFFSSTAAAFGNKGQSDYSAANEVLNKLARQLSARWSKRVVAVAWGPWDGAGMVTPELRRSMVALGTPLIGVDAGVEALLNELRYGHVNETQVIYSGMMEHEAVDPANWKELAPLPLLGTGEVRVDSGRFARHLS